MQAFSDLHSGEQPKQFCLSGKDAKKGAILVSQETASILAAGPNSMVDASREYQLSQPYFPIKGLDPIDPLVQGEFDPSLSEGAERDRYEAVFRVEEALYRASTMAPPVAVHLLELALKNKEIMLKDKGVRSEEAKLASALVRAAEDALRQALRVTSLSALSVVTTSCAFSSCAGRYESSVVARAMAGLKSGSLHGKRFDPKDVALPAVPKGQHTFKEQHHREHYVPSQTYRDSYARGGRGRGRGGRYDGASNSHQNTVPGSRGTGN